MVSRWTRSPLLSQSAFRSTWRKPRNRVFATSSRNHAAAITHEAEAASNKTRNIGIIAHIDAVSISAIHAPLNALTDSIGQNYNHRAHALLQWVH